MTEDKFNSSMVTPKMSTEFQRLVDRLTPLVDKDVKRVAQIVVGLTVAASHLAAKTQRQEPTK